jgi:hypothetical protein
MSYDERVFQFNLNISANLKYYMVLSEYRCVERVKQSA